MIIQTVRFETSLTFDEVLTIATERSDFFTSLPGLIHKYYVALREPNQYGGIYVWESEEAMQAFWASDKARSIPAAYRVVGSPCVRAMDCLFELRGPGRADTVSAAS